MKEPPYGLCYPCSIERVIDGDTVVVRVMGYEVHVRMLDCWAPEVRGKEKASGLVSKARLEAFIGAGKRYSVHIPASHGSLLEIVTFGRIMSRLFVDGEDASEYMVAGGWATKEKEKE